MQAAGAALAVGRGGVNLRRFCRAAAASSTCYRGGEGEVRGGIMHSGTAAADAHAPSQPLDAARAQQLLPPPGMPPSRA